MKKVLIISVLLFTILCITGSLFVSGNSLDSRVRSSVVKLYSARGSCTGEEVQGFKTGLIYTLTAAHCRALFQDDAGNPLLVYAQSQDGTVTPEYFVAEDPFSDLMLLTGVNHNVLQVANTYNFPERVFSITHGMGFPAYKTSGQLLGDMKIQIPLFAIATSQDQLKCDGMPKYKTLETFFGDMCVLNTTEFASSDYVLPGSSGGALLNSDGQIVGVLTGSGSGISVWVELQDLQTFLQDK